jgi:hypothetical protein
MRAGITAVLTVLLLAGCGGTTTTSTTDEPASVSSTTDQSTTTDERSTTDRPTSFERAAARRLMRIYRTSGPTSRAWLVRSVRVQDGEVTVRTRLFPKATNRRRFIGACMAAWQLVDGAERVTVLGSDGVPYALWHDGDTTCTTAGVGS